jgi:hypothetical protein
MLVVRNGLEVVSMASFLPAKLVNDFNGGRLDLEDARYVYAVATDECFRKMGFASTLIEYAYSLWGQTLVLVPASQLLHDYYAKLGFVDCFKKFEKKYCLDKICVDDRHVEFLKISALEYKTLRDANYNSDGYIQWDSKDIEYAMLWNEFYNGYSFKVHIGYANLAGNMAKDYIIMFQICDNQIHIIETTLPEALLSEVLAQLMNKTQTNVSIYSLLGGMAWFADSSKTFEDGYLNLTLG